MDPTGFFCDDNGVCFVIINFLRTNSLAIQDFFYGIKVIVFSSDNIFGYGFWD
jgi:hypothetical protein